MPLAGWLQKIEKRGMRWGYWVWERNEPKPPTSAPIRNARPSDGATNCFQSNTNSVIDHSAGAARTGWLANSLTGSLADCRQCRVGLGSFGTNKASRWTQQPQPVGGWQRDDNLICMQCKCNYYGKGDQERHRIAATWLAPSHNKSNNTPPVPSLRLFVRSRLAEYAAASTAILHKCHYCCRWLSRPPLSQTDWQLNWKVWRHFSLFDLLLLLLQLWLQLQLQLPLLLSSSRSRYAKIGENVFWHFAGAQLLYIVHNFSSLATLRTARHVAKCILVN